VRSLALSRVSPTLNGVSTGFSDAALVLIGHGATINRESAAPVYQHAAELRARHLFAEVREAFWKQEPSIRAVLSSLTARRIFAVPLFVSEGYFTGEKIPAELGLCQPGAKQFARVRQEGERTLHYCAPVGTHPSMTGVILARAREVVERYPFPRAPQPEETALFIAGHGTSRNENSRCAIERQAQLIRLQGIYGEVHAVFMEEHPRIGDCYALARARRLVVVPFFISDGLHACEDIPVLLGEPEPIVRRRLEEGHPAWRNPTEKNGKLVWYAGSVGTEPGLADVIIERAREVV
jgi:sirohydrochlorin cobaltochelatase